MSLNADFPKVELDVWRSTGKAWYLWHDFGGSHGEMLLWYDVRPAYCNRGRFFLRLEGNNVLPSVEQTFPRYYFSSFSLMLEVGEFIRFWDEEYKKG